MKEVINVSKNETQEQPIPTAWRANIIDVVNCIRNNRWIALVNMQSVRKLTKETEKRIANNISAYGCNLLELPPESWESSACQWMMGYWDVIVDLYTEEEGSSDLALCLRVYESGSTFEFEIVSVHVP